MLFTICLLLVSYRLSDYSKAVNRGRPKKRLRSVPVSAGTIVSGS